MAALVGFDFHMLTFKSDHAFHLFHLPLHYSEPFDRQIIAQALSVKITVVTTDQKFRLYNGIQVTW